MSRLDGVGHAAYPLAMDIILASTSLARQNILTRLRVPFRVIPPEFDEALAVRGNRSVEEWALHLARGKAASIATLHPHALVIGADQIVEIDGEALGKPLERTKAVHQLSMLQGRTHRLVTAVAVICRGTEKTHIDVTSVTLRTLNAREIRVYVEIEKPLACAGSYKIESMGPHLMSRVLTEDPSAIEGLPAIALLRLLRIFGFELSPQREDLIP